MIKIEKINNNTIEYLSNYLVQHTVEEIINDFGTILSNNGYGTVFLKPNNPLFTTIFLFEKDGKTKSFGLGGRNLGLSLKELYSYYKCFTERFSIYDDKYVYTFYKTENYAYTIKIYSGNKLIDKNEVIADIDINSFEITIY